MVEQEKTKKKTTAKKVAHKPARAKKIAKAVESTEAPSAMPDLESTDVITEASDTKGAPRYFFAIGRRKTSRAIVRLFTRGSGEMTINKVDWKKYFPTAQLAQIVEAPLIEAGQRNNVNVEITVAGGGKHGQAGAVSLGLARALLKLNPVFRRALRRHGFLTRDSREKERKKYGLKKARRAPQFAKR